LHEQVGTVILCEATNLVVFVIEDT